MDRLVVRAGEKHEMAVGDVINIPPNVPQNWLSPPSSPSRNFIVKVEETR
jgi:hypothetical protein